MVTLAIIDGPKAEVDMNSKISKQSLETEFEKMDLSERKIPSFHKRSISDTILYIGIDPENFLYDINNFTEIGDSDSSEANTLDMNDITNEDMGDFVDLGQYDEELKEPTSEYFGDVEDAYYEELSCLEELEKDIEILEAQISSLKVQLRECERMCQTADEESRILTAMIEEARAYQPGDHVGMARLIELMDEQQRLWNLRFM
ncbi:PREDICTED: uncharacterized protein LOC104819123 [Tarenaya hassleriana]|uniref:uncharacterized protein LOC104819123 n=1 Tax=Tarenaya hassleriana TaxID=28532 RepID=UPI00053C8AF5|nr:PREDICTED: uncharacterized protein LOC104819123 [Tarenaya hassleriana]